jgi:5-(carboxyamino)imidazole ribonucleotide synthase
MAEFTLGILGGGQLARMLAFAAQPLGVEVLAVEPIVDQHGRCSASGAPNVEVIAASFDDPDALAVLASRCDAVTVETENVPLSSLDWLAVRVATRPGAQAVAATQDRVVEKRALRAAGIMTAPFDDVDRSVDQVPALVKTRTGGYDGKGQRRVSTIEELQVARTELAPAIVEGLVGFRRELSIVAARGVDGSFTAYPLVENVHRDGILRRTTAPAVISSEQQATAESMARRLAEQLDYVGVFAIELFDVAGELIANEVAPRVHNSGHWTIEGAETSQFEQHVRAVLGLPLGSSALKAPSVMLNLIGTIPDRIGVVASKHAVWHTYGKADRPGRKVGHITISHDDPHVLADEVARHEALIESPAAQPNKGASTGLGVREAGSDVDGLEDR